MRTNKGAIDWTIRGRKLPIDSAVLRRRPKIVDGFQGNPCESARLGVARAKARADSVVHFGVERRIRQRDDELKAAESKALKLADDLRRFLEAPWGQALTDITTRGVSLPLVAKDSDRQQRAIIACGSLAAAVGELKWIADAARTRREETPKVQPTEDSWMAAFIQELSFTWAGLFGDKPRPSSRAFADFVADAYATLAEDFDFPLALYGDFPEWDRPPFRRRVLEAKQRQYRNKNPETPWTLPQCMKALDRMEDGPEWDRADRYQNDLWPPGTSILNETGDDTRARQIRLKRESERKIEAALEAANGDGPSRAPAKIFLAYVFSCSGQSRKKWMLARGYLVDEVAAATLVTMHGVSENPGSDNAIAATLPGWE